MLNNNWFGDRRSFLGASVAAGVALPAFASYLSANQGAAKRKLVIVAGTPSHPPRMHEFNAGATILAKALKNIPGLQVDLHLNGMTEKVDASLSDAHALMLYSDGGGGHPFLKGDRLKTLGDWVSRGLGVMCCHFAVEVPKDKGANELRSWIGGAYEHEFSCNPIWEADFREFPKHPISNGVKPFQIKDEWYFSIRFRENMQGITPILTAKPSDATRDGPYVYPKGPYKHIQANKGQAEHMMWAFERPDGGRGVGFTGGHFHDNWLDPNFRKVVLNALLWISKLEVPAEGVESTLVKEEIDQNLDPKPVPKKKK